MALSGKAVKVDISNPKLKAEALSQRVSAAGLIASLNVVHELFVTKTEEMFDQEKDPFGTPWPELSESTKAIRQSLGFAEGPINHRTGRMRNDLVEAKADILGASSGIISYAFPRRGFPDSNLQRRYTQASGGGNGPARKVIGMNESDVAKVLLVLNSSFTKGL